MHYTLEGLLNGQTVADWYQTARQHWQEILDQLDPTDSKAIADVAAEEQHWFESNCGGRWIGQEVMVAVAVSQYYTTASGFDENAERVEAMVRGLLASRCSIEIHSHTRAMCRVYDELEQYINSQVTI